MSTSRLRTRWLLPSGRWAVRGRVERFAEPCVLLLLAAGPAHGYELRERIGEIDADADLASVYRVLRGLEFEGFVRSAWDMTIGGPARRTYTITPAGRRLLRQWATALRSTRTSIDRFLELQEAPGGPGRTATMPGGKHG